MGRGILRDEASLSFLFLRRYHGHSFTVFQYCPLVFLSKKGSSKKKTKLHLHGKKQLPFFKKAHYFISLERILKILILKKQSSSNTLREIHIFWMFFLEMWSIKTSTGMYLGMPLNVYVILSNTLFLVLYSFASQNGLASQDIK